MAVKEWLDIRSGRHTSLERGLIAFDMSVLSDRDGDFGLVRTSIVSKDT